MKRKAFLTLGVAIAVASATSAETIAPDDVVYDEYGAVAQSLTGVAGDPVAGEKAMVTKSQGNCIACHAVTALEYAPFHGEVGPTLDGVGDRWTEEELRGIVANAKHTFEGTVMPAMYKVSGFTRPGDFKGKAVPNPPPLLTAQQIEDVVSYLVTLKE